MSSYDSELKDLITDPSTEHISLITFTFDSEILYYTDCGYDVEYDGVIFNGYPFLVVPKHFILEVR